MWTRPDVINRHSKAKGGFTAYKVPLVLVRNRSKVIQRKFLLRRWHIVRAAGERSVFHARRTLNGTSVPPHLNVIGSVAATNTGLNSRFPSRLVVHVDCRVPLVQNMQLFATYHRLVHCPVPHSP